MATTPSIVSVYPAPSARGIILKDQVKVLFDQEMDETSINAGSFVLTGPDEDFVFGPDYNPLDEPGIEDEGILNSPYYPGFVKGEITFQRISTYDGSETDVADYTGEGDKYRTLAIFTPDQPLAPGVEYTAIVAGDENTSDDYDTGVRTRTVFDTKEESVSGSGSVEFGGGYTGDTERTYFVEITTGGPTGQAEYIWWEESAPLDTFPGLSTTGRREIEDGVWVECGADGNFSVGDQFKVVCVPSEKLEDNYSWSFTTGSGSIQVPPSSYSTSGIVDVAGGSAAGTGDAAFTVSSIAPDNRAYNVSTTLNSVVLELSEAPDPTTISASDFSVFSMPVNGDPYDDDSQGGISFSLSVSGNTVTLELDPDQLKPNDLVQIEASGIQDADDGTALTEFSSFFTTTYSPMYTSIRLIRLDLGPIISSVPNETVMLAAYEGSLYVDAISFKSPSTNTEYLAMAKKRLATCMAELILLRGAVGLSLGQDMSKTLADLKVSRGGGDIDATRKLDDLEECVARWRVPVETGGEVSTETSLLPRHAVKGSWAEDAIGVGREWEPTSGIGVNHTPAANAYKRSTSRRWVRTYNKRKKR